MLFTPSLLNIISEQTNLYARQVLSDDGYKKFHEVTQLEIQAYLGFMILMGINKLPCIYDYWKEDPTYHYSPIADRIPRGRFIEISRFLHFTDNASNAVQNTDPLYDRLWKIRPVINSLSKKFLEVYNPHSVCSIDEAMIRFKGRSTMKQYLPQKPVKSGIKVWVRADSVNGYVSEFQVYHGKQGQRETSLGERVVKDLSRALVGKYYTIYCDNYFSSVKLFNDLLKDSIYACGTLRSNRVGYPQEFKPFVKKGLQERGQYIQIQQGNLVFSLWQDNKPVSMLSTNCQIGEGSVQRTQKNGSKLSLPCPLNIIEYNKYMGGVDHSDQLRQYYCVRLKNHKFYKYIFFFLLEVTLANAYILSNFVPSTGHTLRHYVDFMIELARQLIGDYNSRKQKGRPSSIVHCPLFSVQHFPMKAARRSKCSHCYNRKRQLRWTYWRCETCNKYLCHTRKTDSDCFLSFHTK